jgi:hypothetical protein
MGVRSWCECPEEEVRKCDIKQLQERVAKTLSQNKDAEKWIFGRCVVINEKISR